MALLTDPGGVVSVPVTVVKGPVLKALATTVAATTSVGGDAFGATFVRNTDNFDGPNEYIVPGFSLNRTARVLTLLNNQRHAINRIVG